MRPLEDGRRYDAAHVLDGMDRSVFVERSMGPQLVIVAAYLVRIRRKCASPKTTIWPTHSCRIDPIKPFGEGQGEPGAMGLSRMKEK
jgi:hypothetical protein